MQSHASDLLPKPLKDLRDACQFLKKQMAKHDADAYASLDLNDLVHHASRIESNCFSCYADLAPQPQERDEEEEGNENGNGNGNGNEVDGVATGSDPSRAQKDQKDLVIGREVYLAASMLNHSCAPTCEMTRASVCEVRTTRSVQEGEELTISYIDESLPRSHRIKHLRSHYHFECVCPKCTAEDKTKEGKKKAKMKKAKGRKMGAGAQAGAKTADYDSQVDQAMRNLLMS